MKTIHNVIFNWWTLLILVALISLTGCVTPRNIVSPPPNMLIEGMDRCEWGLKTLKLRSSTVECMPRGEK